MSFPLLRRCVLALLALLCVACEVPSRITNDIGELSSEAGLSTHSSNEFETANLARKTLEHRDSEQIDWEKLSRRADTLAYAAKNAATNADNIDNLLDERLAVEATAIPLNALLDGIAEQLTITWQSTEPLNQVVNWDMPEQSATSVLDQLAARFNLAWELIDGVLQVQGPEPFAAFYPVDYLNLERAFSSSVGLATEVGTMRGVGESVGSGNENSSSTTITNLSAQQFWQSLHSDLELWLSGESDNARWSINKDTGLISLYASPNTHRQLAQYLEKVASTSQRQVLIEASVVEVLLSDDFEAGIDWQLLAQGLEGITAIQQLHGLGPLSSATVDTAPNPSGLITFTQNFQQSEFSATFQLLEQFGEARIVSRPQILALNNQPAVLKVVDNRVYFTVSVERQQSADTTERFTETQIHTVPVGLVMNVTPHIGEDDVVMLNVRPSLSRILGFVDDPNPDLNGANINNGVPEIQVREMESVLRIPSGSIAVIGGLMQSVEDDRKRQLPGLANLPGLGAVFGQRKQQRQRTELFIVIKPTVINTHRAQTKVRSLL